MLVKCIENTQEKRFHQTQYKFCLQVLTTDIEIRLASAAGALNVKYAKKLKFYWYSFTRKQALMALQANICIRKNDGDDKKTFYN